MKVLISTLGYRSDPVKALFTQKGANKLILVPGKPAWEVLPEEEVTEEVLKNKDKHNPVKVAERAQSEFRKLGLEVKIEPVNAFNFDECLKTIINILKKESGNEITVGVGPGTFLISAAALSACWIKGVKRAFYVRESRGKVPEIVKVPVPCPGAFKELKEKSKRVLHILDEQKEMIAKDIAEKENIGALYKTDKYLFSWDEVRRGDNKEIRRFLRDDYGFSLEENAEICKSSDDKIISISNMEEKLVEIRLSRNRKKATLKIIRRSETFDLKVKENDKLKIYKEEEKRRLNTLSSILDKLEKEGLVESEPETEGDKRETKWHLTNFGQLKLHL